MELPRFRASLIHTVANAVLELDLAHPIRVAVDGRTASGKTTFANQLAASIEQSRRPVIRASIDGFHRPRDIRHRQGRLSPDGYYEDARDMEAMRALLLDPLGPNGKRSFVTEIFDLEHDQPLAHRIRRASENAILIVDGTFLQRPELRPAWDFVIFLDISEEEARRHGISRDKRLIGGEASASELYRQRYGPAFDRYQAECRPLEQADLVIDNGPSERTIRPSAKSGLKNR